nr:unnamed protein product [Callosobruchus chinensis]
MHAPVSPLFGDIISTFSTDNSNGGRKNEGKKGVKKKVVDQFTRKDWYYVKAPSMFATRQVGKTLDNRTQGTKIASEGLKHRVFKVSFADLQNDDDEEKSSESSVSLLKMYKGEMY